MAVHDLSPLASLSMGCSMSNGNTIADVPWGGSAGSPSEAVKAADPPVNDPEPQLGHAADHALFVHSGHRETFAAHGWQAAYSDVRP
jgi:hypothetical protein